MKKIILSLFLVLCTLTSLNASTKKVSEDKVTLSKSSFFKGDKLVTVTSGSSIITIADKSSFSIFDQTPSEIETGLKKFICSAPKMKSVIDEGYQAHYIFMYMDGTITTVVDSCN